jgi:tRNA(adenine34) deaminase
MEYQLWVHSKVDKMMDFPQRDLFWMKKCLDLAQRAGDRGEVPVGACLISETGELISKGFNLRESLLSPLAHAELLAIQKASKKKKTWRLPGTTLYVTLEPCPMCMGALVQARVQRLVFGAFDPKAGAAKTLFQIGSDKRLNHQIEILGGVLENECSSLLKDFFKDLRKKKKLS